MSDDTLGANLHKAIINMCRLIHQNDPFGTTTVILPFHSFRLFAEEFPSMKGLTESGHSKAYITRDISLYTENGKVTVKSE